MINICNTLSKKYKQIVEGYLNLLTDIYSDFYLTDNNIRLAIRENKEILYKLLRKGDVIVFDDEDEGLAIIIGFAEKRNRKYLKILTKNKKIANKLIRNALWNIESDLYVKIKKINPLKEILMKCGFVFKGSRGKEVLLYRKYIKENKNDRPTQD